MRVRGRCLQDPGPDVGRHHQDGGLQGERRAGGDVPAGPPRHQRLRRGRAPGRHLGPERGRRGAAAGGRLGHTQPGPAAGLGPREAAALLAAEDAPRRAASAEEPDGQGQQEEPRGGVVPRRRQVSGRLRRADTHTVTDWGGVLLLSHRHSLISKMFLLG